MISLSKDKVLELFLILKTNEISKLNDMILSYGILCKDHNILKNQDYSVFKRYGVREDDDFRKEKNKNAARNIMY